MNTCRLKLLKLFSIVSAFLILSNVNAQIDSSDRFVGYVELNGGIMRYSSDQNNLTVNPAFGFCGKQQFTRVAGVEVLYSAVMIDEHVLYYSKNSGSEERHEQYVANWFGLRALFGKNTDSWSLNAFLGVGFRMEKRAALYLEAGVKFNCQLHNAFWLHTAAYVQVDRFIIDNLDPGQSTPLNVGLFGNFRIGMGYHFNEGKF